MVVSPTNSLVGLTTTVVVVLSVLQVDSIVGLPTTVAVVLSVLQVVLPSISNLIPIQKDG